mmetsp:Transcript_21685/g.65191  ORF Transcript_21685/g.65191 Transcript_21685/m.65191 type:complete len:205 (-) Transcript_21685:25-639(-)
MCRPSRAAFADAGESNCTRAKPDGRPSRFATSWIEASSFKERRCTPRNLFTSETVARYGRPRIWTAASFSSSSSSFLLWPAAPASAPVASTAALFGCLAALAPVLPAAVLSPVMPNSRVTLSLPGWPETWKSSGYFCSQLRRPPFSFTPWRRGPGSSAPKSLRSSECLGRCPSNWTSCASRAGSCNWPLPGSPPPLFPGPAPGA